MQSATSGGDYLRVTSTEHCAFISQAPTNPENMQQCATTLLYLALRALVRPIVAQLTGLPCCCDQYVVIQRAVRIPR